VHTIGEVAALANVTVRTLHHYDAIGLVRPSGRTEAGYRLYDRSDLERLHHHEHMLRAIDQAIAAHEGGQPMSDDTLFEVFGEDQREYQQEAEGRWGNTDAYRESRRRTADYTREDWEELKAESEALTLRIAEAFRTGAAADSEVAMDAVEAHRRQISERFYDCSHEMHRSLGEMYVADPRFRATYEAIEPGLSEWVRDAITANARRATG